MEYKFITLRKQDALPGDMWCPCNAGRRFDQCHGRRMVALVMDDEGQVINFSEDLLLNQLRRERPKFAAAFDKSYGAELQELSAEMAMLAALQMRGLFGIEKSDQRALDCWALLDNAYKTVLAAIVLLRDGLPLQAGALLRTAIELVAEATAIFIRPELHVDFVAGKLAGSKSISVAKEALPLIGKFYGTLSEHFTHVGPLHRTPHKYRPVSEQDLPTGTVLSMSATTLNIVYIASELVFLQHLAVPRYWRPVGPGFAYDPSPAERHRQFVFNSIGATQAKPNGLAGVRRDASE